MEELNQESMLDCWKQIFNGYYRVSVKTLYTYRQSDIEIFGLPATGDEYWDGVSANARSLMNYTIAELAELHNRHVSFTFADQRHIELVYQHVDNYIVNMVEAFNRNYITEHMVTRNEYYSEIINDLQILANLANHLRPYVAWGRSVDEQAKSQKTQKGLSLLAKMIDIERKKEFDETSLPREINIRDNMSSTLRGDTSRPTRTIKPWRNRRG